MAEEEKCAACGEDIPEELRILRKVSGQLDGLEGRIEVIEKRAIKAGATAGAVAGALSGGVVAAGIALLRAKLGM